MSRRVIGWAQPMPEIGDRVRFIGMPKGEHRFGTGLPPNVRWVNGGAMGIVVEIIDGYPGHACPDHYDAPDCVCGNLDDGRIEENPTAPIVDWATHPTGGMKRCLDPDDEGMSWERVAS